MEELLKIINAVCEKIRYGDCVLFLGPDLLLAKNNNKLNEEFAAELYKEIYSLGIAFDNSQAGNLSYTVERYINGKNKQAGFPVETDVSVKRKYTEFINKNAVYPAVYDSLSKLPFHLIINTNPDNRIHELIRQNRADQTHFFWYYDNTKENNETIAQSKLPDEIGPGKNVTYNVFGFKGESQSIAHHSIILKEAEFLNYTKNVHLPNNRIPAVITNFIDNNKTCIFLGFRHESWYLKVLLKALGFPKAPSNSSISLAHPFCASSFTHFFEDEMKFLFIDNNPDAFTDILLNSYDKIFGNKEEGNEPVKKEAVNLVYISDLSGSADSIIEKRFRDRIANQLKPLEYNGTLVQWSEESLEAGDRLSVELSEKYDKTDIFILLSGVNFWATPFAKRVPEAMKRINNKTAAALIPVYLRDSLLPENTGINKQDWLPQITDGGSLVTVADNSENAQDKKIADVCRHITNIIYTTRDGKKIV